jgi:hypothetical protein
VLGEELFGLVPRTFGVEQDVLEVLLPLMKRGEQRLPRVLAEYEEESEEHDHCPEGERRLRLEDVRIAPARMTFRRGVLG